MSKYLAIAKTYMKTQLVWRVDVAFNMIFTISKILFAYLLWGIIFQSRSSIGDFTFHGMISYYIISSFLSQLDMSSGVSNEIHDRIRNGTFTKYMIIPAGIEKYFLSMEMGVVSFYFLFDFIAAVIWIFLFRIEFTFTTNPYFIVTAIVLTCIGMFFMFQR